MTSDIRIGDKVRLNFGFLDQTGRGDYEVVRVMPASVDGEIQYRVRGTDGHERAIGAKQIRNSDGTDELIG
ncbi:hypothetical protein [Bosea sp. (in: a-proteobacteria)]|uniref:hypothetical protein n=1 Tax=Bosea sp. (in: a-proteobacteria) TaxID=1871050 RepID=UPI002B49E18B|nr:hypothetical protein [Bosea sp. (in: a-proteobacteria)]WRH60088.1 MAG: hypothetical protein RSE11_10070 [Bosea sp. (in: a-proteobacteria)]